MRAQLGQPKTDSLLGRSRVPARSPAEIQTPALHLAGEFDASAFATSVALNHAGMLSATEAQLIQYAPLGEARYKAICDVFAAHAVHKISSLSHRR